MAGREVFVHQMDRLDAHVLEMAKLAKSMLGDGLDALEALDVDLAESVAKRAQELASMDEAIETEALGILMLQAPVAKDLRRIGAILKLITSINRIGRYGYDIAKVVKVLKDPNPKAISSLRQMSQEVERMVDIALDAFQKRIAPDTKLIMELETDVDAQRHTVWRSCLTYMAEDPRTIEACAHIMMVARYLERCGDHVVKMAEKLHYAATGQRIILN
jgi:phosphate transport system protein